MAKPLTEILSPAAWGALQLGLAALQDQKEDKVALDYMAKLLRYLAFIWDQLSLWSRLLWFFACICIKLGLWGRLPSRWRHKLRAIGCIHSLRDSITTGCPPADINLLFYDCRCLFSAKSGWVPKEYLEFTPGQVRKLQAHPRALPWAIAEKATLHVLDCISGSIFKQDFGEHVTQLVPAVATLETDAGTTPTKAAQGGGRAPDVPVLTFLKQITAIAKLSTAGAATARGFKVFGGAGIMRGAAQAGKALEGRIIAALMGVSPSVAGLAASGWGPAMMAYTVVDTFAPNNEAGNVARTAGAAAAIMAVFTTAASLAGSSGPAIMSSLAWVGSFFGGGAAVGTVALAAAPAAAVVGAGAAAYGLHQLLRDQHAPAAHPASLKKLLQPFAAVLRPNMMDVLIKANITAQQLLNMDAEQVEVLFPGDPWILARLVLVCVIGYLRIKSTL